MVFIETSIFTRQIRDLISDDQLRVLQDWIAASPVAGNLIKGKLVIWKSGRSKMEVKLFEELLGSVKEAGQILKGQRPPSRVFVLDALDVKDIRESLKLSQYQFAALVHVSVKTLRNWEQGIRRPGGAAAALLTAIRNDPKNVIAALNANQDHRSQA